MPIYEYEPVDRDCLICEGRVEVIQGIHDKPFEFCPHCGLAVSRIVSKVSIQVSKKASPDQAAKKGFSTFRRAQKGVWEKVAGPDEPAPPPSENPEGDDPSPEGGILKL